MNPVSVWTLKGPSPRVATVAAVVLLLAIALTLTLISTSNAEAQTYTVIHYFTDGGDGATPQAGLTEDAAGNFYGTAFYGGNLDGNCGQYGCGVVFKLKQSSSGWVLTPIYSFQGGNDGAGPIGRVAIARDGTLYGTTYLGGGSNCNSGCGTVFHLRPPTAAPKSALFSWNETVIYRFTGGSDGANPLGDLIFDQSGNIYGTAVNGGSFAGVIYKLTPSGSGWAETVLYSPQDSNNGINPYGGVIFDSSGNLYGVFRNGGPSSTGTVYELSPSGSGWTEQTIHAFNGRDGAYPEGGLILDSSGNIYGTTPFAGMGGGGTVFQLMPANGGWAFNTLYSFSGGSGPQDKLAMDAAGNLYGTTYFGQNNLGSVFELKPSNGSWMYDPLHNFSGSDGAYLISNIVFDSSGNLYGTTSGGGEGNCGFSACGVIFEITP
jgi:uncharacterized repeat protein (TIGR03803 family)